MEAMLQLVALGFALAAAPGPDTFLLLRNTLASGRTAGYLTLLGNRLSLAVHISLAIAGLSAILARSETLFLAIRLAGAAYLVYLGVSKLVALRRAARPAEETRAASFEGLAAVRQGFLNNLLNPKVSLFFLSLFPQFTTPEMLSGSPWMVAVAFVGGNSLWYVPLVFVVGYPRLRSAIQRFQRALDGVFGLAFIGFGLRIALQQGR
jgi:RhtB (resistance to homoserine/threonine) family protein